MMKDFRVKIGLFGKTNVGKSSLLNALTNQNIAIVSDKSGTTTDRVSKAMELLPLGPVKIIDTPGIDDTSEIGSKRVEVAMKTLEEVDIALLVISPEKPFGDYERAVLERAKEKGVKVIGVLNKSDTVDFRPIVEKLSAESGVKFIPVSAKTGEGIIALKREIVRSSRTVFDYLVIGDLVSGGEAVAFVIPELRYPRGRLPLCYVRAMREVIDCDAYCIVTTPSKLLGSPVLKLVVLDTLLSVRDMEKCFDFYDSLQFTSFAALEARKYLEVFVKNAREAESRGVQLVENTKDEREKKIIEELKKEIRERGIEKGEIEVLPESCEPKNPKNSTTAGLLLLELRGFLDRLLDPFPLAKMGFGEVIEAGSSLSANVWKW